MERQQFYTTSPAHRKLSVSPGSGKDERGKHKIVSGSIHGGNDGKRRVAPPLPFSYRHSTPSGWDKDDGIHGHEKMFGLFETKANTNVLHSVRDDALAASVYGCDGIDLASKRKEPPKRSKSGVSGYDFDSLIKDERPSYYFGSL